MADTSMYKITFGRDRYHQHRDMEDWCRQHLGEGGWHTVNPDDLREEANWSIDQMFGNTTFRFKNARDYSKFVVKWEWANGQDSIS